MTDKKDSPVTDLRHILRMTMAMFVKSRQGVDDSHLMAALAAVLCEALLVREVPIDDAIETIRKTYEVVQMQMAMMEKEENSVQ